MDVPQQTQVYIDSLEPRWFYGIKSFSETSIGAVPSALANAIYNACGVRIREHPITRDKIMAGLKRTVACSVARLTDEFSTPGSFAMAFSTRRTHEAQVIPSMGRIASSVCTV